MNMSSVFDDAVYKRLFKISSGRLDLFDETTRELLDTSHKSGAVRRASVDGGEENSPTEDAA